MARGTGGGSGGWRMAAPVAGQADGAGEDGHMIVRVLRLESWIRPRVRVPSR